LEEGGRLALIVEIMRPGEAAVKLDAARKAGDVFDNDAVVAGTVEW
jgi:hypothetical protein